MRYAREHAGETCEDIPSECRQEMRHLVVSQLEFDLGFHPDLRRGRLRLADTLFDSFSILNLDWRLIAATEIGECRLQGYIAAQTPGTHVRWMETRSGACPMCAALDGQMFTVAPAAASRKDWFRHVWRGKSRVRISATAGTPTGIWPAAGLQHEGCRGSWTREPGPPPGVSKDFVAWLKARLAKGRLAPLSDDKDDDDGTYEQETAQPAQYRCTGTPTSSSGWRLREDIC